MARVPSRPNTPTLITESRATATYGAHTTDEVDVHEAVVQGDRESETVAVRSLAPKSNPRTVTANLPVVGKL